MVEHDGTRLEILMGRAGVSQAQLADAAKVTEQAVWKWVKSGKIARKHLATICARLRCSSDELLGISPIERKAPSVADQPSSIFSKERRSNDDVLALQIVVESLASAILRQSPGAIAEFLAELVRVSERMNFSYGHGLVGSLVDIAHEAERETGAVAQVQRRAGSAGGTKRGNRDQER